MGQPFDEPPYPPLTAQDFGPGLAYRVELQNAGRVAIGEASDRGFQTAHSQLQPVPGMVDVVIHGLPGRFIDMLAGFRQIAPEVVASLLQAAGIARGTRLRLVTCHAAEVPLHGREGCGPPPSGLARGRGFGIIPDFPMKEGPMVVLKPVLQVRELPPSMEKLRRHLPSLRDFLAHAPSTREAELVEYLAKGVVGGLFLDRGLAFDVLERERRVVIPNGPSSPGAILTDGTWLWCGTLPYYVARYHLRLPEEFVRFVERRGWRIDPASFDARAIDCAAYDSVEAPAMAD